VTDAEYRKLAEQIIEVLHDEHVGDFVYEIREHAREGDSTFTGNSWEHPRVIRWGQMATNVEKLYAASTLDHTEATVRHLEENNG